MLRYILCMCLFAVMACQSAPVQPGVAGSSNLPLPVFPDYPAPQTRLQVGQTGDIYFPTRSPYDFVRVLNGYEALPVHSGKGTLFLPKAASPDRPVPAMVILHGSGGIQPGREFRYAEFFTDMGIAAFVVDYYASRGVSATTPYVMKTMAATEVDVMADAYSALKILATHPAIDKTRIGVTGYSYGGMATRYVLDERLRTIMAPEVAPFALHMDIYGPCHQNLGYTGTTGAPYLAIYGDKDNSVDPKTCAQVQADLRVGGSSVDAHIIEGAGHAWENAAPQGEFGGSYVRDCEFSFDAEGRFLINGQAGALPTPDMSREERAFIRAQLGHLAKGCIGQGYTVGHNAAADKISRALQADFVRRVFGL